MRFGLSYYADMVCVSVQLPLPVSEGDCQFSLGDVLEAFREQAEELRLKVGLQQTVILGLMEDEEIILSRTEGKNRPLRATQARQKGNSKSLHKSSHVRLLELFKLKLYQAVPEVKMAILGFSLSVMAE